MAATQIDLSGGTGGAGGQTVYTAPNGVVVTSSAPTYTNGSLYYLGYIFNGNKDTGANTDLWLTNSSGNQTLTFDMDAYANDPITQISVYPKSRTDASSNYSIDVSNDGTNWTEVVSLVTNSTSLALGTERLHDGLNITQRYIRFNLTRNDSWGVTLHEIELYEDSASSGGGGSSPSGGETSLVEISEQWYAIHKFTTDGTFTVPEAITAEILVVGGGGGGGETIGGGGGGGEVRQLSNIALSSGSYTVTVGAGGAGGETGVTGGGSYPGGDSGGASSFDTYTAAGGGAGGGYNESGIGTGGGHGGGQGAGGGAGIAPGTGKNAGGTSGGNTNSGAGGGGANGVGSNASSGSPGAGGAGIDLSAYFGTSLGDSGFFGAGGGGGARNPSGGTGALGGTGGGGKGGTGAEAGTAGTPNTGSGGGGGGYRNSPIFQGSGGAGGTGVVLVRYETTAPTPTDSYKILGFEPVYMQDFGGE